MDIYTALFSASFDSYLAGHSALERYFRHHDSAVITIRTTGSLVDLSRLFDGLSFTKADSYDAMLEDDGRLYLFQSVDEEEVRRPRGRFLQSTFLYDLKRDKYLDPADAYPHLREKELTESAQTAPAGWEEAAEAAVLAARFGYRPPEVSPEAATAARGGTNGRRRYPVLPEDEQRTILSLVLTGAHTAAGLRVLADTGFIAAHWPLLEEMHQVRHSKEHHPEGDVWEHTLETFSYRKIYTLPLSLGLLLHDCGKPFAKEENGRRFDRHAQIGGRKAERFLRELGFAGQTVEDVRFLVEYHMVPGALPRLPIRRTEQIMAAEIFPLLLELYRCDVSSTFRGPEGYYEACKVYRSFLKHRNNPFRTSDGKKMVKLLVEA
jgi:poly(A) polymerase